MKLKPTSAEVWFKYLCPKCGCQFLKTIKEIKYVGKEVCYCGYVLEFERMELVNVNPVYGCTTKTTRINPSFIPSKPKLPEPPDNKILQTNINLTNGLVQLGYKKATATGLVSNFVGSNRFNPNETDDKNFLELLKGLRT